MRFKVTLRRPAGDVDLTVTADATASVADVADQLAAGDPGSPVPPAPTAPFRSTSTGVPPDDSTRR